MECRTTEVNLLLSRTYKSIFITTEQITTTWNLNCCIPKNYIECGEFTSKSVQQFSLTANNIKRVRCCFKHRKTPCTLYVHAPAIGPATRHRVRSICAGPCYRPSAQAPCTLYVHDPAIGPATRHRVRSMCRPL